MGKLNKKVNKFGPIKYYFCNYCGKGVSSINIVWGWNPGPSIYCSESCKTKIDKKEVLPNETSLCSNVG